MTKPEIVVFDLGKVLLDFDYSIAARKLASLGSVDLNKWRSFIDQSPLLFAYETGELTSEQFYKEVCAPCGFRGSFDEFGECFGDIFRPIEPMVELHRALRAKGVPTYVLSNTNELAIGHIRRRFPFFSQFDGYVLSFEARSMKPQPEIYAELERRTGRGGGQILYIDDRPENIEAARARNWQTTHHVSSEETWAAVKKTGLL